MQVTLAQEEERRRISRELHDGLGPSLAAIANRLKANRLLVRAEPERAEEEMEEISWALRGHIREIRELIYELRPLTLDQLGLAEALAQQVQRFEGQMGIRAGFRCEVAVALHPLAEVTIYRVLQECLGNVQKHSGDREVEVSLESVPGGLEMRVKDDGVGIEASQTAPTSGGTGLGLTSMKERANLLGGEFWLESSTGKGCEAVFFSPYKEVEDGSDSSAIGGRSYAISQGGPDADGADGGGGGGGRGEQRTGGGEPGQGAAAGRDTHGHPDAVHQRN